MTRRCSHCSHNGHNSRTCPNRVVKLFGVRLTDGSIRKSASMGNLTHVHQNGAVLESPGDTPDHPSSRSVAAEGYASEDFVAGHSSSRERKKGVPWTEEEHRMFLLGLQKLGKGDWRGIAHNYVISRTPTQVASHAQKYFIRQSKVTRRKRRSSLFDIVVDDFADTPVFPRDREFFPVNPEANNTTPAPATVEEECESMESANPVDAETTLPQPEASQYSFPIVCPAYVAAPIFPVQVAPISFWPTFSAAEPKEEVHQVVKPTAIHAKTPINVDQLIGMSKLSLECSPSPPSLKLVDLSTRPSAFHAKPGSGSCSRHNPIHAV